MRHILSVVVLFLAACAPAPRPSTAPRAPAAVPSLAEQVVQTQVEAFNRGDIDAFLATYAPDLKMYSHPSQKLMMSGLEQARQRYAAAFATAAKLPNERVEIATRIVQGNFVIDHEVFTGAPDEKEFRVVAWPSRRLDVARDRERPLLRRPCSRATPRRSASPCRPTGSVSS